ncbi:MAG: hypothetical protein Kow0063_26420 [Anaerolineae bacterium]
MSRRLGLHVAYAVRTNLPDDLQEDDLVNEIQLALLLFFVAFLPALYLSAWRVQRGDTPGLRPIVAFNALQSVIARAIERGRAVHVSSGLGGITGDITADSLAGLSALEYLANQSAAAGVPPIVSVADPTLLPLAQDMIRRPYGADQEAAGKAAREVRWIAPEPAAYAAGVLGVLGVEAIDANVMIGTFGDEYLLMGEAAHRKGVTQIGGASDPGVVPFVFITADHTLIGEEMYATGAYLAQKPWHVGSLLAQDFMRWIIVFVIVTLVLIRTLV